MLHRGVDYFSKSAISYVFMPYVKTEIVDPVRSLLVLLPKSTTEIDKDMKRNCINCLRLLSENSINLIRDEKRIDREILISKYLQNVVLMMHKDETRNVAFKIAAINEIQALLEQELEDRLTKTSSQLSGLLKKFKNPQEYGGAAAVRSLTPSLSEPLKEELFRVLTLQDQLNIFFQSAIAYIGQE
jgi:hypothetical protein